LHAEETLKFIHADDFAGTVVVNLQIE